MRTALLPLLVLLPLSETPAAFAGETTFVIGARPWNFTPRSRENHLNFQLRGPGSAGPNNGGGLTSGYPGFPVSSSANAIGNWVQVEMNLGDGSEGLIMIENDQTNSGDQQAVSDALGEIIKVFQTEDSTNSR